MTPEGGIHGDVWKTKRDATADPPRAPGPIHLNRYVVHPAYSGPYRLEDEVKSGITVVAKTHHYWLAHARADRGGDACTRLSSRSR